MRMPRARSRPTRSSRSRWSLMSSSSSRAAWMETMRFCPWDRMDAGRGARAPARASTFIGHLRDPEAELPLGLLDAALKVTHGVHLAQVDTDGDKRLRDLGREPRDDDVRAHQP